MSDLPAASPAIEAESSELEGLMRTSPAEYNRREGRYRELLEARETGGVVSRPAAAAKERAEIERVMLENPRRYYGDEELQARYRALLGDDAPTERQAEMREPGDPLLVKLPSEWAKEGGDPADHGNYSLAVAAANDMLNGAGADAAALETSFEALPGRIHAICLSEMVNRQPVAVEPFTDDEKEEVIREGRIAGLLREWGADAPAKLGKVRARLWRAIDQMDDQEAVRFMTWFGGLPPGAAVSLHRWLAEGR